MSFADNLSTRTVVGTFLTPRGTPASGYVVFTPRVLTHSTVDDALVFPTAIKKNLDSTGSFSVELLDTDNADLAPAGWGYAISYRIDKSPHHDFFAMVPAGDSDLNVADLTPLAEEEFDDSLYVPHSIVFGNNGGLPTTMVVPINNVVGRLDDDLVAIPITDLDAPEMMRYFEVWDADTAYPSYSVVSHEDSLWLWAVEDDTELGDEPGVNASWLSLAGNTVHSVNGQVGVVVLDHDDVGAAASVHTHANTDITGLGTAAVADTGTGATNVILGNDSRLDDSRTPLSHTHPNTDITGLGTAATADTGTGATNVILGNDSRLTDARTPTAHAASHAAAGGDPVTLAQSQITNLTTDLGNKADLVGGVVPTSQIPSLAINDTFVVASEVAMLALTAEIGDVAIRTDLNRNFVLQVAGASTLGHWVQLSGGSDVVSVNSQTGNVVLGYSDVGAAPTSHTHAHTDITGLGTAAVADTGTGSSNVILGNDARLTDTRTPSASSIVDAMIATTLSPSKITGTAAILGANTFTAQQFIDGSSDQIQQRIQGHSTQTGNLTTWETSAGTVVGSVSGSGAFTSNINSGIYWSGGASFTGTPNPGLTVVNRNPGGYDPLIQAQAATSTGALKTVFAFGAVGTGNWDNATTATQISDFYILTRGTSDALVERLRISSAGVLTTKGQNFIDGSSDQIQLRVQGHSVQNANLQTWESSAAAVVASVSGTGKGLFTSIGPTSGNFNILDSGGSIAIQVRTSDVTIPYKIIASATTGSEAFKTFGNAVMTVSNAANVPLQVRGYTAQSANLQTWENSSASVLASISAAGLGTFAGVTSTTGTFSSDVSVGAGSAAVDSLLTINGGTNTGKGGAIAFKRGGSSKGYLGTRSFVIGGSTDDISLISYADLTLGIGSIILMAMSSSANTLNAYSSTAIPVVAKGFSAQTANLQEWQNSSGTALASVSSAGLGTFAGVTSTENVAVTKSQSATTRIAVTNGSTNANALAEIRAATDAGYTGLFKHPAAYGGYKILGAGDAAMYNATAGHMSFLNDYSSGVIRFAAGGASSAQVQIETTGKLTTFTPTTAAASVRLPHGTAPSTPVNGDMWTTDAGLYVHVNGSTVGPLS